MTFIIYDKSAKTQHTLAIDDAEACINIKRRLLQTTDFGSHRSKQLYVHVPLCFFHCSFCVYKGDLLHSKSQTIDYLSALRTEIKILSPIVNSISFESVFIGGGTVTVLDALQLRALLKDITNNFRIGGSSGEFTVELAPHGLSTAKLDVLTEFGVNRVTMGLQSLDNSLLRSMNRPIIPLGKIKSLISEIHNRHFLDANFDLMIGIQGRSYENLRADFRQLMDWGCNSIMVYIDMHSYRDKSRGSEVDLLKSMLEKLANEFSTDYCLNHGHGANEYNRFISNNRKNATTFSSRYSTDYLSNEIFCLGLGRQSKSWNQEILVHWD